MIQLQQTTRVNHLSDKAKLPRVIKFNKSHPNISLDSSLDSRRICVSTCREKSIEYRDSRKIHASECDVTFERYRINTSALPIKVSTEEALVVLFACEICHRSICSKFDSFPCGSHGTIFDIRINKHFEQFHSILTCRLFVK